MWLCYTSPVYAVRRIQIQIQCLQSNHSNDDHNARPTPGPQCHSIDELEIIGVDGNSCIKASAMGGYQVTVTEACVCAVNQVRFDNTKALPEARGVMFR